MAGPLTESPSLGFVHESVGKRGDESPKVKIRNRERKCTECRKYAEIPLRYALALPPPRVPVILRPWTPEPKGQVERTISYLEWPFLPLRTFEDLADLRPSTTPGPTK